MADEIKKLIDGNKKFRKNFFNKNNALFHELVERGQRPKTMVLACSDSRVNPSMIFSCQPGDLFLIRSMANLVPPCEDMSTYHGTSATLEFGTCFLQVEHIIILGHTRCGGIQALIEGADNPANKNPHSFIAKWMEIARPAYDKVVAEHAHASLEEKIILCEQYTLINSLNNLRSFPWIQERVNAGKLALHAWYLDLTTGIVHIYDEQNERWFFYE
jgi:carbonic anhydrase